MPATVTYRSREYIWGPGDWGVDELLVQYDQGRRASWPLQDAGGDVIALCDLGGTSGTARVITQIVYDAYGSVIGRDDPATPATGPPELRVGHKGLFFDRLDGGIADPLTGFDLPRLWPGARLSGYVRNRTLHCDFGRWNQPDPNATGLPVQAFAAYHGGGISPNVQGFDLRGHFRDGANVYAYLGGNPPNNSDALGLEYNYVNIQYTTAQRASMQSTQMGQYGAAARAGSEYGVSMSGALPGLGTAGGGAVGSLTGVKALVAWMTSGALAASPLLGIIVYDSSARIGGGGPAGEQPLPGERAKGIAGRGWEGDAKWRAAVRDASNGGDFPTGTHGVPTLQEALRILSQARATVVRIDPAHAPGGVSTHTYPHINYTTSNGKKGTIQIQ